jgi:adenylylsulfate kinase
MERIGCAPEALLIITGSMGSGKTAVLGEASDILTFRGVPHASIDLDAFGTAHLPLKAINNSVMYRNLRSVWENYAALGLTRLMLARAIENRAELKRCRDGVAGAKAVICRLTASVETMQQRVRSREPGILQRSYVERVAELTAILDHAQLEDFSVVNENRSITDVAQEMLMRAGWL